VPEPAAHVDPVMNGHAAAFTDADSVPTRPRLAEPDGKPWVHLPEDDHQYRDMVGDVASEMREIGWLVQGDSIVTLDTDRFRAINRHDEQPILKSEQCRAHGLFNRRRWRHLTCFRAYCSRTRPIIDLLRRQHPIQPPLLPPRCIPSHVRRDDLGDQIAQRDPLPSTEVIRRK